MKKPIISLMVLFLSFSIFAGPPQDDGIVNNQGTMYINAYIKKNTGAPDAATADYNDVKLFSAVNDLTEILEEKATSYLNLDKSVADMYLPEGASVATLQWKGVLANLDTGTTVNKRTITISYFPSGGNPGDTFNLVREGSTDQTISFELTLNVDNCRFIKSTNNVVNGEDGSEARITTLQPDNAHSYKLSLTNSTKKGLEWIFEGTFKMHINKDDFKKAASGKYRAVIAVAITVGE